MIDRSTLIAGVSVVVAGVSLAFAWQTASTADDLTARVARLEAARVARPAETAPGRRNDFDGDADNAADNDRRIAVNDVDAPRARRVPGNEVDAAPTSARDVDTDAPVQELVRRELQRAEDEREQARDAPRQQRVVERVQAFAAAHQLTEAQQQSMTTMLTAEQQEIRQVMQDARDGDSFDGVRDRVRDIRRATDDNVKAVLDADQMKAFAATREEEAARFRGFGPPPGGPPGAASDVDAGPR